MLNGTGHYSEAIKQEAKAMSKEALKSALQKCDEKFEPRRHKIYSEVLGGKQNKAIPAKGWVLGASFENFGD